MRCAAAVLMLAALLPARPAQAQPCTEAACAAWYPDDSGAINVRSYGARGDGHTDDTASLLAAIAASGGDTGRAIWHDRIVFLPAGNYLVSGTLLKRYSNGKFASGMILVGESPGSTVLRLADHAPGFGDPGTPKPVVMTSSKLIDKPAGRDYAGRGEGNDAYENFIENLTIDVGNNNPGAIGIDYLANNIGAIRDVIVRAPAGSGTTGIAMLRKWPGPALLQRVTVQGFDVGIDVGHTEYGMTLSKVQLSDQRVAGLRNADNMVTAEDLKIEGTTGVPLLNTTANGMLMLVGGKIGLPKSDAAVLENRGTIVFDATRLPPSEAIPELPASGLANGWLEGQTWHSEVPAWSLTHPQAPRVTAGPRDRWVGVAGSDNNAPPADSTAALQAAFASAATVYLRHGTFWISAPLEIPATMHRLIGMNSTLRVLPQYRGGFPRERGMLRVLQPGSPMEIEHLALDNTDEGKQSGIEVSADRTLLVRDVLGAGVVTLDRRAGGGPAFLENTCCGTIHVAGSAPVVARQLNTEGNGVRIHNNGSPLVILGLKTEGYCTAVSSESGASTALLGGLLYVVRMPGPNPVPAFITVNANLTARFVEESLRPASHYVTYLSDRGAGGTGDVAAEAMPKRDLGRIVPLLWAGEAPERN
jgi:hypothetical protein